MYDGVITGNLFFDERCLGSIKKTQFCIVKDSEKRENQLFLKRVN
jgi:hypothetical protein